MPVVYRYGHFGGVARLVGDNDLLLAVCGSKDKAAVFIKRDLRAVYSDGIYIFLVNGDRLRLAVGLAVLNARRSPAEHCQALCGRSEDMLCSGSRQQALHKQYIPR